MCTSGKPVIRVAYDAQSFGLSILDKIRRPKNREGCSLLQIFNRCPAVPHTVFVRRLRHHGPYAPVSRLPLWLLKEGGKNVGVEPVAFVGVGRMLGESYTLAFIVQPVHLVLCVREFGIQVSTKYLPFVVGILFHIGPQIKVCDIGVCRV